MSVYADAYEIFVELRGFKDARERVKEYQWHGCRVGDIVYFAEGWQNTRGCVIEHECAVRYGIPIIKD